MSNADVSKQRNISADIDRSIPYDPIEQPRYDGSVNNQGNPFEANDGVSQARNC